MLSRRKDWLVTPIVSLLQTGLEGYYDISYHHTERLNPLKDKPFVLLPNHQRALDILLEGVLLQRTLQRNADYVMKSSLPGFLKYFGGLSIVRKMDVKNGNLRSAIEEKEKVYGSKIPMSLYNGGIVVIHPQGTRGQTPLHSVKANLNNLLKSQKALRTQITFVPLEIKYGDSRDISMTVGLPLKVEDSQEGLEKLAEHWLSKKTYS